MFISINRPSFHLWWKENSVKNQKVSKYYETDCRLTFVTYPSLCITCVTYKTPCHVNGHQVLPIQPLPREVEGFPRGDKHFKHVPLLTYLICISRKGVYMVGSIYMPKPPPGTLISISLVLNWHFKSPIRW